MLTRINKILRNILLVLGAVLVLVKLTDEKQTAEGTEREGFQTEEFDDIW